MEYTEQFLEDILADLDLADHVRPEEIPDIALYMDQVTTFMDAHLAAGKRHSSDKILTKTMINNYAKNDLLPPPEKKKYSKEHLLVLIFIYYFKSFLSITDIQSLIHPLTEKYFRSQAGVNLENVYREVFRLEETQIDRIREETREMYQISQETFADVPEEDQDFLRQFSFLCMLSYDVYLKKQIIEKMIDRIPDI